MLESHIMTKKKISGILIAQRTKGILTLTLLHLSKVEAILFLRICQDVPTIP